jgi:hypothetical protein
VREQRLGGGPDRHRQHSAEHHDDLGRAGADHHLAKHHNGAADHDGTGHIQPGYIRLQRLLRVGPRTSGPAVVLGWGRLIVVGFLVGLVVGVLRHVLGADLLAYRRGDSERAPSHDREA